MNNSLAEVHPELVSEWSEKNLPLTPDDITFGSNKKVWWRGACGHEWQTSVKARSNGEKCPICSGARVIAGINDLATLEPLLVKQWSKKNKIKPTEVSIGSHKKVIWRCEKGHEWEAAVKSRTINRTGCPYCSHNKVLGGFNDLATLLPDIAAEWSDRNYPLLPTQVTVFANRKVARRGYDVTGIDITPAYIDYANEQAKKENLNAKFICQDIRTITFDKEFDVVLNMADGAIGYLENDGENHKIFSVIAKALKNGGKHFMDIMNGSYA